MQLRLRRNGAWAVVVMSALVMGLFFVMPFTGTARATDSNQVDFWCDEGIKIEPIDTPSFTVPPPPDGFTWTLLVVKSATDNETFPNPIPGQSYTPSNGHDVSHVILCMEPIPTTTTTSTTTTTITTPTTTDPPPTTTTTTSPTTDPPPSTTTSTHVDPPPVTVTIPSGDTTTTEPPPIGGVSAGGGSTAAGGSGAAVLWLAGGALALLTGAALVAQRRGARGL